MFLLGVSSYVFSGKSAFHPAVIFCSFWFIDLCFLVAVGDFFYPVHTKSLLIEILGAASFCVGSFLASRIKQRPKKPSLRADKLITLGTWLVILSIPLYIKVLMGLVADRGVGATFLMSVRQTTIEIQGTGLISNFYGLVISLSTVIAMIAFRARKGHRFRCYVAVLSAFMICFLTATKGGPVFLILGLLFIHWLETRKLNLKALTVVALVFIGVTVAIEFYVHINGDSITESLVPVARNAAIYVSGPIVIFDQIAENPKIVPLYNSPYDALRRMSNKFFGTKLTVSPGIPEFVSLGQFAPEGNTYTFYGGWFDFGAVEAILAVGFCGFLTTLVFSRAAQGGATSAILYAVLVPFICFMPYTDYLTSIYVNGFTALTAWMIYYFPDRYSRFRQAIHVAVQDDLKQFTAAAPPPRN